MIHVKKVKIKKDFELLVTFSTGETKQVNLAAYLNGPIFAPLTNPTYFNQVSVCPDIETIVWPNGADFAPEFLYQTGQLVETEQLAQ